MVKERQLDEFRGELSLMYDHDAVNRLAEGIITKRLNTICDLPLEKQQDAVILLFLALARSIAVLGHVFLKKVPEQPRQVGAKVGEHVTSIMQMLREEGDCAEAETVEDDPW